MSGSHRWRTIIAGSIAALAFAACGGGGDDGGGSSSTGSLAITDASAPAQTNNIAVDGRNWINYRRSQAGVPPVAENVQIDAAAQAHSDYQRLNNTVTHDEEKGQPGFTGVTLKDRLNAAKWTVPDSGFAFGEIIAATTNQSGFFLAEELITAIYHRFVMFEPMFQEIGTGAATTNAGYTYFTADLGSRSGFGPGIAPGAIVSWPYNGQTQVTTNFFSDFEEPDPVPDKDINEVGYPISVHANLDEIMTLKSFSVRPRGGSDLNVRVLAPGGDATTPMYAAAIIPLSPLRSATIYDVTFVGTLDGTPVSKNWSFTTR
jgi:uncharacterized protein YkwD